MSRVESTQGRGPEIGKPKRAVILISGGLDSTVAAGIAKSRGFELYFMFANYGQKTLEKERESVDKIAEHYHPKELVNVDLTWLSQIGKSGLFDSETQLDETNFLLEYVPFRNSVLLSAATAWAETIGADAVFIGSSGGDHICPDNSPQYLRAFQRVVKEGTMLKRDIKLEAPLSRMEKTGTIELGLSLDVPFELTWSCHNNVDTACGHCSNCLSRLQAFETIRGKDPIRYVKKAEV